VTITGVVEGKAAGSLWSFFTSWSKRDREQKNKIESLKAELVEERSGRLAFERQMAELECRPDDDHMYWRKDGKGGPYCPTCIHETKKIIPLTHGSEGAFYCIIHKWYFETHEHRQREQQARSVRLHSGRRPSPRGPHSWMGS
jgi:hypothetical protein